jgi:hypothetical protein
MKHYITKSNFIRIAKKFTPVIDDENTEVYTKNIPFFSHVESKGILTIKQFLINSKDGFIKFVGSGFIEDTKSFIFEESRHAKYHTDIECRGLNSAYTDIEIPVEIKYTEGSEIVNESKVEEFRNWFKQTEITNLYYNDQQRFIDKLQLKFNLLNPPRPIEISNGDYQEFNNLTLGEVTNEIDKILHSVDTFYNQSEKYKKILVTCNFSTKTFLVTSKKYRDKKINGNDSGYSDQEVRIVLTDFYKQIKKPILNLITNYWILKLNAVLDFNKTLLDQMEFEPCKICNQYQSQYVEDIDIDDGDDLPF